jgi:signal transduction histidine kinase
VRDNVPVAGRPLTPPAGDGHGIVVPFELLFYGSVVGTAILVLVTAEATRLEQLVFGGLCASIAAWYAVVGHPVTVRHDSPLRAALAVAGLLAGFTAALKLTPAAAYLLIGLPALMYLMLPDLFAHICAVVLCAAPTAVYLIQTRDLAGAEHSTIPIGVASIVFTLIIATVISRVARRSEERGRLIEELQATRAELARVSHEAGIAEERQRLAGEIHDTVAQGLSSVVMLVQAADAALESDPAAARAHLALAARTARENLAETRAIVAALTPAPLAAASLPEALRRLVDAATRQTSTAVTVAVEGQPRPAPTATEVVLLRAAQEGLANALRHAQARAVQLSLTYGPGAVVLEVRDDGRGLPSGEPLPGYGLQTMRARTEQIGGTMTIQSGQNPGTTLRIEVPT